MFVDVYTVTIIRIIMVLVKVNKMVFTSQTHLLLLYLMYYSGNMFRLSIELSSGPYIKIQILNLL